MATSGGSDVRGTVSVDSSSLFPNFDLNLNSRLLRSKDIGLRASGRSTEPLSPLLLSNAMLNPQVLRNREAVVRYRADRVEMGRLPLEQVSLNATIDHDVLTVAPLSAKVLGGKVNGHLTARCASNASARQMWISGLAGLQLELIDHKPADQPPVEGPLQAQVTVTGTGSSVHQVASSANGTVMVENPARNDSRFLRGTHGCRPCAAWVCC
ncbi:MAG: AsmA family protein [Steroidobacteraceae bacterium]